MFFFPWFFVFFVFVLFCFVFFFYGFEENTYAFILAWAQHRFWRTIFSSILTEKKKKKRFLDVSAGGELMKG